LKDDQLIKKLDYEMISDFTSYCYLSKDKRKILTSVQDQNKTYVNLLYLKKNVYSKELHPISCDNMKVLDGKDWVLNQSDDLKHIIGQSSSSQKIVIFDL
jgi:hypothetical protein